MADLPAKVQLHEKYKNKGVEIITVNVDGEEGLEAARTVLEKASITTTNWCLAEAMDTSVQEDLGIELLPVLKIYDRDGELADAIVGEIEHEKLEEMIERILAKG